MSFTVHGIADAAYALPFKVKQIKTYKSTQFSSGAALYVAGSTTSNEE